jgi:hypothetical protein
MYFTESHDKNQPLGSRLNGSPERVTTKLSWKIGLPPNQMHQLRFREQTSPTDSGLLVPVGRQAIFSLLDSTYRAKAKPY